MQVTKAVIRNFKLFRRPRTATDHVPPATASRINGPDEGLDFGMNPDLARAIATPDGKRWLVPGDGVMCLATVGGAGSCTTNRAFLQGTYSTLGSCRLAGGGGRAIELFGFLPDSARALAVVRANHVSQRARLLPNFWYADVVVHSKADLPTHAVWLERDGTTHSVDVAAPAEVLTDPCVSVRR